MSEPRTVKIDDAIYAVEKWVMMKQDLGQTVYPADPSHSALLYRLMMGREPLPHPPPRCMSRPAYHYYDAESCGVNAWIVGEDYPKEGVEIVIDQCADGWRIVERDEDGVLTVEWQGRDCFTLIPRSDDRFNNYTLRRITGDEP